MKLVEVKLACACGAEGIFLAKSERAAEALAEKGGWKLYREPGKKIVARCRKHKDVKPKKAKGAK